MLSNPTHTHTHTAKAVSSDSLKYLYILSFIEGGVVMVTELAGAKLLTPYFGASLYSWAATLAITLLALMCGYYFGGYVTTLKKYKSPKNVIYVFLLSGMMVLLMPMTGKFIMQQTLSFSFFAGLIVSQMFFLFPPVFLMGMISPMIIYQITETAEKSGRSAGNIYAISTCGGILFTLIFGFGIIPHYGISIPVIVLGIAVTIFALALLIKQKTSVLKAGLLFAFIIVLSGISFSKQTEEYLLLRPNAMLVTQSEGLLGELQITDEVMRHPNGQPFKSRILKTNKMLQNYVFLDSPTISLTYYVNFTKYLIEQMPEKKSALLIGLGAGSIYAVLENQGMDVETVEIDKRIYDYGVEYFGMKDHKEDNTITDGRYFINTTDKKYDLIILDVIIGENVAGQLVTIESFQKIFEMLNKDGMLMVEHGGLQNITENKFIPSVVKTLEKAGFQVNIFNPLRNTNYGDILFIATKERFEKEKYTIPPNFMLPAGPVSQFEIPVTFFDNKKAHVLTDEKNDIDILLKSHYMALREQLRKELLTIQAIKEQSR